MTFSACWNGDGKGLLESGATEGTPGFVDPAIVIDRLKQVLRDSDLDPEDPHLAQEILGAGIRLLGHHADEGRFTRPYPEDAGVTASEVAISSSLMLQAAGVEIFELAMWQTWAGQTRIPHSESDAPLTKGVNSVG